MAQNGHVDVEVTGIDHLYVSVTNLERAEAFYDRVMRLLGFRKGTLAISGEPHRHYFNRETQLTIRPARTDGPHEPYAPGLHHLCFRVPGRPEVDTVARELAALGVPASVPRLYPEYAADYYATFFEDPDGLRLEIVANRKLRDTIRDHWDELVEFENPVAKAGLS